jgi:hypothetical protein
MIMGACLVMWILDIKQEDINKLLTNMKTGKAIDVDETVPRIPPKYTYCLHQLHEDIYKKCLETGGVPTELKRAKM